MSIFKPKLMLERYEDLDIDHFKKQGIKAVLLDLDNTLAPYYEKKINAKALSFIDSLKKAGLKVMIVSNNTQERVGGFIDSHDIDFVYYALKPLNKGYKEALRRLGVSNKEVISLGDQLLTDVLGSNLAGIYSIYVKPIIDKDSITTKFNRKIERLLFKYWVKK